MPCLYVFLKFKKILKRFFTSIVQSGENGTAVFVLTL